MNHVSFFAALAAGVISGWGVGGGTLLVIFMVFVQGLEQRRAQGINLAYFIPTAAGALSIHAKEKLIDYQCVIPAAIAGTVTAACSSLLAGSVNTDILKRIFGILLIAVGIKEIFTRRKS